VDWRRRLRSARSLIDAEIEPISAHGGSHREQVDNINLKTKGGTNPTYTLKRLKRVGTRSAQSIRASGHTRRINRPDT